MGCGGSTMPTGREDDAGTKLAVPPAVAFSVPLTEHEDTAATKGLAPKRLRMMEGQESPPLTRQMLQEKMADAEQRRQQILNQRIESAKTLTRPRYNGVNRTNGGDDDALDDEPDARVPEEQC